MIQDLVSLNKMISSWDELCKVINESYGIRHTYGGRKKIELNGCEWITGVDLNLYRYDVEKKIKEIRIYVHVKKNVHNIDLKINNGYAVRWRLSNEFDYDFYGTFEDFVKQINEIL